MIDKVSSPERPPVVQKEKHSFLEDSLGAMNRELFLKGIRMKYGMQKGEKTPPRGMATHKGDIY